MKIVFTKHAEEMIIFRHISKTTIRRCLIHPDKILSGKEGKQIYLKDLGQKFLKVIIVEMKDRKVVVTLYWLAKRRLKA